MSRIPWMAIFLPALVACTRPAPPPAQISPYNVILISLDTLRADRLGVYGFKAWDITPSLDRLAAKSVIFENAYSTASITTGSHMSMFTGLSPLEHRTSNVVLRSPRADPLPEFLSPAIRTLPELMKRAGLRTARFVYARDFFLDEALGFGRGFDEFYPFGLDSLNSTFWVRGWLARNKDAPFFLFLHSKRPHSPYVFSEEQLKAKNALRLLGGSYRGPVLASENKLSEKVLRQGRLGVMPGILPEASTFDDSVRPGNRVDKDRIKTLYELAVNLTDQYVGGIIDELEGLDLLDKTILIVTSDHGEQLLDHGAMSHHRLTRVETRVPLLIRLPPRLRETVRLARVSADVQTSDLLPTILNLMEQPVPAKMSGKDLGILFRGEKPRLHEEILSVNAFTGIHRSWTLRNPQWSLQYDDQGKRLFARETDPEELTDVSSRFPEVLRDMDLRLKVLELRSYEFDPEGP